MQHSTFPCPATTTPELVKIIFNITHFGTFYFVISNDQDLYQLKLLMLYLEIRSNCLFNHGSHLMK